MEFPPLQNVMLQCFLDRYDSWNKYKLDISTMHPKFKPTRVQTHDLQIMDSTFQVPEKLILTTELSGSF